MPKSKRKNNSDDTNTLTPPKRLRYDDYDEPRANRAVTHDGARYNKLKRPDSFPTIVPPQALPADDTPNDAISESIDESEEQEDDAVQHRGGAHAESLSGKGAGSYGSTSRQGQRHPDTGQASALEIPDGSDDEGRGIAAYLASVRAERVALPQILNTASLRPQSAHVDDSLYESGHGDSRGYYSSGAYMAAPNVGLAMPPERLRAPPVDKNLAENSVEPAIAPQSAYSSRILTHFWKQRRILAQTPAAQSVISLRSDQLISLPPSYHAAEHDWREHILASSPHPAQVSSISQSDTLRILEQCRRLLKRNTNIGNRVSQWVWALLARLSDAGTMTNDEVAVVRELGKRAIWVGCGFQGEQIAVATEPFGGEEDEDEARVEESQEWIRNESQSPILKPQIANAKIVVKKGPGDEQTRLETLATSTLSGGRDEELNDALRTRAELESDPDVLQKARERLLADLAEEQPDEIPPHVEPEEDDVRVTKETRDIPDSNTRATLDMIILIAGEVYGQRDLLEFRDLWTAA